MAFPSPLSGPLSEPAGSLDVDPRTAPRRFLHQGHMLRHNTCRIIRPTRNAVKLKQCLWMSNEAQLLMLTLSDDGFASQLPKAFSADLDVPYILPEPILPSVCCSYPVPSTTCCDHFSGKYPDSDPHLD